MLLLLTNLLKTLLKLIHLNSLTQHYLLILNLIFSKSMAMTLFSLKMISTVPAPLYLPQSPLNLLPVQFLRLMINTPAFLLYTLQTQEVSLSSTGIFCRDSRTIVLIWSRSRRPGKILIRRITMIKLILSRTILDIPGSPMLGQSTRMMAL